VGGKEHTIYLIEIDLPIRFRLEQFKNSVLLYESNKTLYYRMSALMCDNTCY
jgi:hypothetical protein